MTVLQACLNGNRPRADHPAVPITASEIAEDAWTVLDAALARGRDIRIGLEDTLVLSDGSRARGNADLVAEALEGLSGSRA